MRVVVLHNDDAALAAGTAEDSVAMQSVVACAAGVAESCRANGWDAAVLAAPADPRALLAALGAARGDVVFNLVEAVHGDARREAAVAWLLELAGVPYTGSPPIAMTLGLHKDVAKAVLAARGVAVPPGRALATGDEPLDGIGPPPWIVKPVREDASHGIAAESVVATEEAARAQVRRIVATYRQPALVERFVEGREFNVGVVGEGAAARALPLSEIDYTHFPAGLPRLITYTAKWDEESAECRGSVPGPPRDLDEATARRVAATAEAAYAALGLRDYGRVDMRLDPAGVPLVLDVNPNPDISPGDGLANAALRAGVDHAALVSWVVRSALARAGRGPWPQPLRP